MTRAKLTEFLECGSRERKSVAQEAPVAHHRGVGHVAVGLVAERGHPLAVVRAREALRVNVASLRNQTHGDMQHSTMVRYRRMLRASG